MRYTLLTGVSIVTVCALIISFTGTKPGACIWVAEYGEPAVQAKYVGTSNGEHWYLTNGELRALNGSYMECTP